MRLVIFGGTGGVGRQVVLQALEAGQEGTAFARSPEKLTPHPRLTVVKGQLGDADGVSKVMEGADAVISALGARVNTADQVEVFGAAMQKITAAMKTHGVARLVAISGAMVVVTPEDHMTVRRRVVSFLLRSMQKHLARAKEREYEIITATGLDWVIVRPPRIVEGPARGDYRVLADRAPSSSISQGDVADFMLKCVSEDRWVGKAPIPGY